MNRRKFLCNAGFWTFSLAVGQAGAQGFGLAQGCDSRHDAACRARGAHWKFPQSVASADPRPDSAILWTRVVPTAADDILTAADAADVAIRLIVTGHDNSAKLGSNQPLSGPTVVDDWVPALAKWDNSVRHKVGGLRPATTYYYQFIAGDVRSRVGRFKTAPAAEADIAHLNFVFMTCQDWTINHWAAFDEIVANEDIDFFVHLGDYIYEAVDAEFVPGKAEARHDQLLLPDGMPEPTDSSMTAATSLADYRYLYKKYRSDSRLQALHEHFAMIAIWDDHEFSDDCWHDRETYDNGTYDPTTGFGDNTAQPDRRRNANQAWFEFMPADVLYDDRGSGYDTIRLYRDFRFGQLAHFVVTDERLYRADHIVPEAMPNPLTSTELGQIGARYFVVKQLRDSVEAAKIAAHADAADPLAPVSMLGTHQRQWWKDTMRHSRATWKLWCNEVSLLRMGLNGTDAIATLIALNSVAILAATIGTTAASTGGDIAVAGASVAAMTAGANQLTAVAGASSIAAALAGGANPLAAAEDAGLSAAQAGIAVAAFGAAVSANGTSAQVAAAAQTIAFGCIKTDIQAHGAASSFLPAQYAPYCTEFLFDCDQWDGYDAERRDLMAYLKSHGIPNVVAITGDIHAFHAGLVYDNYDTGSGAPAIVDLVTAGVSSDSSFNYYADAADELGDSLSTLVYYPLSIPVPGLGTLSIRFDLFDFTLAKAAPSLDQLAEQARVQVRGALAAAGVPEAALDASTDAVLDDLKTDAGFAGSLLSLASVLAGLNNNPWIKYVSTDAQGYAVVNLSRNGLTCTFRQMNKLVAGDSAPTAPRVARSTVLKVAAGSAALAVS